MIEILFISNPRNRIFLGEDGPYLLSLLFYGSTTSRVDCFGGGQFYCRACRGEGNLNAVARCRTLSHAVARCRTLSHAVAKAHGGTWWNMVEPRRGKNMGLILNGFIVYI